MQTVKVFIVGTNLFEQDIRNLVCKTGQAEVVGRSACADSADTIIKLQPQVIIHLAGANEDDCRLIGIAMRSLPDVCYIALGDTASMMFRVRCNAAGANHILDQRDGLIQVRKILQSLSSKPSEGSASPRHSENADKNKAETPKPRPVIDHRSTPNLDCDKLFSTMNKSPFGLMFADRGLVLRHLNPAALAIFKPLEPHLPVKTAYLVGQPLDIFHRKHGVMRKIISDTRNLPYQTQIIIGPKTLALQVRVAPHDDHFLGVIAHWTEITSAISAG